MAATKEKDGGAPAIPRKINTPRASSTFSIPVSKAAVKTNNINPRLVLPFSSSPLQLMDAVTGKPLPHYLRPTVSSCHDICKYGKRHGSFDPQPPPLARPRRSSNVKQPESESLPSQFPSSPLSSSWERKSSSASNTPRHASSGKALIASPFIRAVSFGRSTPNAARTSLKPKETHLRPATTIPPKQRHPPATSNNPVTGVKKTAKIVSCTASTIAVSNAKKTAKCSDPSNVQEDSKTIIVTDESVGAESRSQESKQLHEWPLLFSENRTKDISISEAQTTIRTQVNESTEQKETAVMVAIEEQVEERKSSGAVENYASTSSWKEEQYPPSALPGEPPQDGHYNNLEVINIDEKDVPYEPGLHLVDVSVIEEESKEEEKEHDEKEEEKENEQEGEELEKIENLEEDTEVLNVEDYDSSYDDEYLEGYYGESDEEDKDHQEEERKVAKEIENEQRPTAENPIVPKVRSVGEVRKANDAPRKLRFQRGTVLTPKDTDHENENKPKKMRFRRGRVYINNKTKELDGELASSSSTRIIRRSFKRKGDDDENAATTKSKKDVGSVVFNQVIEQTANKLVESRKSKVKALVGAFETVISIQETDA